MDWKGHSQRGSGDGHQKYPHTGEPNNQCFQRYRWYYLASHIFLVIVLVKI